MLTWQNWTNNLQEYANKLNFHICTRKKVLDLNILERNNLNLFYLHFFLTQTCRLCCNCYVNDCINVFWLLQGIALIFFKFCSQILQSIIKLVSMHSFQQLSIKSFVEFTILLILSKRNHILVALFSCVNNIFRDFDWMNWNVVSFFCTAFRVCFDIWITSFSDEMF